MILKKTFLIFDNDFENDREFEPLLQELHDHNEDSDDYWQVGNIFNGNRFGLLSRL